MEFPLRLLLGRLRLRLGLRPGWEGEVDMSVLKSSWLDWGSEVTVRLLRLGAESLGADDEKSLFAMRLKTKWKGASCWRLWSSALIF